YSKKQRLIGGMGTGIEIGWQAPAMPLLPAYRRARICQWIGVTGRDVPFSRFPYPSPKVLITEIVGRMVRMGLRHSLGGGAGYPAPAHCVFAVIAAYPLIRPDCVI